MLKIVRKLKISHIFWVLFYLFLFGMLLRGSFSYLDPDLGWHLKVGEEISVSRQVPRINTYNYTYTGNWIDHEWLSNLASYQIYNSFGYETLVVIFAVLIIIVLVLLNIFVYKYGRNNYSLWLIATLQVFGILASLPHFGVRMQELALLFITPLLIIIYYFNKYKDWRLLIVLPFLFFLWANLHASFLIGFFIIISWLFIKIAEKVFAKYNKIKIFDLSNKITSKQITIFAGFSLLSVLAACLTPYKLELFGFLGGYQNKAYLSLIQEWLPQYHYPFHYKQLIYLALGLSAVSLYIYNKLREKKGVEIWKIYLPLVLFILSLKSCRHFPLFFIVSFGLMTEVFGEQLIKIKIAYLNSIRALIIFCLGLLVALQFLTIKYFDNPFSSFCKNYPCQAINFLKDSPEYLDSKILNSYGWGGFMNWVYPEKKTFIDGRLPQVEFAGHTFIQEYFSFFEDNGKQKDKLEFYDVHLVLIEARDKFEQAKKWEQFLFGINNSRLIYRNYLREYLENSNDWEIIYQDKTAKIYFR